MFNPLGNFSIEAPLDQAALEAAKAFEALLPPVPAGKLERGYFHWTVAPLGMCFNDYNFESRYVNGKWILTITHDPRDNAPGLDDNAEASHTYMRNSGAIGFAITGMDGTGVGIHNFGIDPITVAGLEYLCAGMAAVCKKYGIDVSGKSTGEPYGNEPNLLTHAEAANHPGNPQQYDNYFITGERWDLATFCPLPTAVTLTADMATTCGNALRARTHAYKEAM